jgi:lysophospholipase L1-like esterase
MNTGKTLEEQHFQEQYQQYLQQLREQTDADILCITPFIFPYPAEFATWIPAVRQAEQMITQAAQSFGATVLLTQDLLQEAARQEGYPAITVDGIHLTGRGHQMLAGAMELTMKDISFSVQESLMYR